MVINDTRIIDMPESRRLQSKDFAMAIEFFKRFAPAGHTVTVVPERAPWPTGSMAIGVLQLITGGEPQDTDPIYAMVAMPYDAPKYVVSVRPEKGEGCAECVVVLDSPPDKYWLKEMSQRANQLHYSIEVSQTMPVRKNIEECLDQIEELVRDAIESEEDLRWQRID